MPSLPIILLAQAILIGLILLFRDYRDHMDGPPAWWRLWVKPVPPVAATPTPAVASSAGTSAATTEDKSAASTPSAAAAVTGGAKTGYYGKIDSTNSVLLALIAVVIFMLWNKK